jgi:cardiolipin synthase
MIHSRKEISPAALLAVLLLVTGCASHGPSVRSEAEAPTDSIAENDNSLSGSGNLVARRGAAVVQGGVLLARSFPADAVNRPVSNVLSIGSYALKSAGGFAHRLVIGAAQFPALETREIPAVNRGEAMDLAEWEQELDRITGRKSSRGSIDLLVDGEEYFERMLEAVDAAEDSIDVRTYIFDNDDFAVEVADHLRKRSRDVDVRVMFDGLGNLMALQTDPDSMPAGFRAPVSMEQYLENDSKVRVRTLSNPWMTGDHTKTTIIDRKIAFIGGMNIGREYRYDWHDLMMEVRGPVVDQLTHDTNKAWAKAGIFGDVAYLLTSLRGKKRFAESQGYPVRTLYTREFDSEIYQAQLAAIRRAKRYIYIENSYFSDDATLYELARARRRGVDVRVVLPADGNHGSHDASNAVAIERMLRNGIRVYRYPGMSHVKAAVIDGWASVGTANFDKLSLQVNKEVNLATSHPEFVNELLERVFYADIEMSDEVAEAPDLTLQARLLEMVVDEVL